MTLQSRSLEPLLNKAKELEKEYEWLQAAKNYKKASELSMAVEDHSKAVELQERAGFCFYRAAMQAETNAEFRSVVKQSILAYEKEAKLLEDANRKKHQFKIDHAKAMVAYVRSWYETDPDKVKALVDEWWTLENHVLEIYERIGNTFFVGVVCTDLIEFALNARLWLSTHSEEAKLEKEAYTLAEKAIRTLLKSGDTYELARAYCFASVWYCSQSHSAPELRDKRAQILKEGHDYSKKALTLSSKTGDAWLIGQAHNSAVVAATWYDCNTELAIDHSEKAQKYGSIAKDKLLLSHATDSIAYHTTLLAEFLEDPDKQRTSYEKARKLAQDGIQLAQIINNMGTVNWGYRNIVWVLSMLASIETDPENKQVLLQNAIKRAREGLDISRGWKRLPGVLYEPLSSSLRLLSETKSDVEEKKKLLLEAQSCQRKHIANNAEFVPFLYSMQSLAYYNLGWVQIELAKTEKTEKGEFIKEAVVSLEKSYELLAKEVKLHPENVLVTQILGKHSDKLGRALQQSYHLTNEEKTRCRAIEMHNKAAATFTRAELPTHAAESYWGIAQLEGQACEHQKASKNYESASQAYEMASKNIPQFKRFYEDYSLYMQAWSQLEQARLNHSLEEYETARQNYEEASMLHESTGQWSYLAPNYSAWASMEEAEGLSRNENTQQAKDVFQKGLEQFTEAEKTIKDKIGEITSAEEKEMTQKLLQASDLRRKYCQARILVEEAKLLDREGRYRQSSKSYSEAAKNILSIIEKTDAEAERKELEYLATLCQAWEKMAVAEETASSELYLEAAEFFEEAKGYCFTRKASLWALGNSNFCRGLAAENQFQSTLKRSFHSMANKYVKQAANYYKQAGFQSASDYAKATQRLFDAYLYMNSAEDEVAPEKKTKFYQLAEQLLQIAAGLFTRAKQPEKTTEVQGILATVREEKALASSLNEVMHAPALTSSTMSFTAPTPTSEASVGLESFENANVQANLLVGLKEVRIGESFCLSVEFVNAGKEPALLTKVDDFIPSGFVVVEKPEIYRLEESCLNMKGKQIAPLKLVEAKVILQPLRKGVYQLNPKVHYLDSDGQNKSLQLKSVEIKVEEVVLANRVSTGTKELDALLLGGIPEEYSVALTGAPSDERELVIVNFLEAEEEEISFYVTTEAVGLEKLLQKPNFYLFLCNPRPKVKVPDLPNVYKLHSKADINNLNIALVKAYRAVERASNKKIAINIVSDVLANYTMKTTRKWIAELTTDLISKGFTIIAVINPLAHSSEEINNLLELFDGEISLTQTEDPLECRKSLRVKKLRNQDYIENPICLAKQK